MKIAYFGKLLTIYLVVAAMTLIAVPLHVSALPDGTPISTLAELQAIGNDAVSLAGTYYLANDIDASDTSTWNGGDGFMPIGNNTDAFTGIFDGNGHVITNLTINLPTSASWGTGLFGFISDGCEIVNLGLENADISGGIATGGLVGGTGMHATDCRISDCYISGNVFGTSDVGGIIGSNRGAEIIRCHSTASVNGTLAYAGGFAGYNSQQGIIDSCYATGDVVDTSAHIGGFIGANVGTIRQCSSTGNVSGGHATGGFIGTNASSTVNGNQQGSISDCYATGDVIGTDCVGGFAGKNWASVTSRSLISTIADCYSTGNVTATDSDPEVGGFAGLLGLDSVIQNCYWNVDTSSQATSHGGTGKTTCGMITQSTFTGWDFIDVWEIQGAITYPYFWWQTAPYPAPLPLPDCTAKGDFDSNGCIELYDFVEFAGDFGSQTGDPNYNPVGDFDDNGDIGLYDFVEFAGVFGTCT